MTPADERLTAHDAERPLMVRYCATAAGLGVGWFVVLLIPRMTRDWLLEDVGRNLGCLVAASVLVAVACRGFIGRAATPRDHMVRAAVIPYLGCFVFLSLWAALLGAGAILRGGSINVHDTLSLYVMGLTAVTLSLYVVIPYGLLCQHVMTRVARSWPG